MLSPFQLVGLMMLWPDAAGAPPSGSAVTTLDYNWFGECWCWVPASTAAPETLDFNWYGESVGTMGTG